MTGLVDFPYTPLRPSELPEDLERYLDIDRFGDAFEAFTTAVGRPADLIGRGMLVLVAGDRGCGKTSLIYRCTHWLREEAARPQSPSRGPEIAIVDLSRGGAAQGDSEKRIKRTLRTMVDKLSSYLDEEDVKELQKEAERDTTYAFGQLSDRLAEANRAPKEDRGAVVAATILPGRQTVAEMLRYAELTSPGMVFFAEIYDPEVAEECESRLATVGNYQAPALCLTLGKLKQGDARAMILAIVAATATLPQVPDPIIEKYFERAITSKGMAAGELHKAAYGIRTLASQRSAPSVDDSDVAEYYQDATWRYQNQAQRYQAMVDKGQ